MSKLKVINNYTSNESPYKLFSSGNEFSTENKSISKSTINPHYYYSKNKNSKNNDNILSARPFSSKTKDDREVSSISKKLKSITLSNESYSNYINYYCNLTQDHTFKTPRISSYPLRKNEKYLPITSQQNYGNSNASGGDSIFLNFMKETDQNTIKNIEKKPYGYKYGETKIRIDRKRAKSAYTNTINPKDFQNLCETNIFESELLKQIGLQNIDIYNSNDENNNNYTFFNDYLQKFKEIDDLFNYDNSYKSISFHSRTAIIKKTINFKLEIYSLCFKFYLLGNKSNPQKLFFPFKLLPLFYLLDFQIFKVFLSEIIYYDNKNNCMAFINNDSLLTKIKKYYSFISNTSEKDSKYFNFITYNKNELCFYYIYDWIISNIKEKNENNDDNENNNNNDNNDNYKCYKLKITLPKIKFFIDNYNMKIIKHLNKHIIAKIIINNFKDWERFILFDLFCNKRFKTITNLIMLNKHNKIKDNKIYLNIDPNKHLINNKKLEFYLSINGENFSNFYILVPYIILLLYGEKKKKYQKIHLSLIESKNLVKFKQYWGIINTLLKCMFIDTTTNNISFRLDLLENVNKDLYKIIKQENSNLNTVITNKNKNIHNILYGRKNSSKNNLVHIKEKDKDKDKNKTKYKSNILEISLLDCTLKKISISAVKLESKYYKIPENVLKCIFSIKEEKDLFNNNFNDISIIGKCIGECSNDIINSVEENIKNEEDIMKKRAKDSSVKNPTFKSMEKFQSEKIPHLNSNNNKGTMNNLNRLKTFKVTQKVTGEKYNNIIMKKPEEKQKFQKPIVKVIKTVNEKEKHEKHEKHEEQKFNLRFGEEYKGYRDNFSKRKLTISNVNDLNRNRIDFDYNSREDIKKKITNKY